MENNKKIIEPNERSLLRWIATVAVGFLLGVLFSIPVVLLQQESPETFKSTFVGIPVEVISNLIYFAGLFFGFVVALKWIAKTSLKDFVLGAGGTVNKKECLIFVGLQTLGLGLSAIISIPQISLRGVKAETFFVLIVLMLIFTWMQTTWEELLFRGVFLRWACKNKIGYTKKAFIGLVISSIIFALAHIGNTEISSMRGFELVVGVFCYLVPGVVFYWANVQFGSLLPGIIIHWINNLLLFTIISGEVTSFAIPTLFVDQTEHSAGFILLSTFVSYVPVIAYILWSQIKRKRAALPQAD